MITMTRVEKALLIKPSLSIAEFAHPFRLKEIPGNCYLVGYAHGGYISAGLGVGGSFIKPAI